MEIEKLKGDEELEDQKGVLMDESQFCQGKIIKFQECRQMFISGCELVQHPKNYMNKELVPTGIGIRSFQIRCWLKN